MERGRELIARLPTREFSSDNTAGASPEVIEAIVASNAGQVSSYGTDQASARLERQFAELFEHEVSVFLVPTGTAANALCLSVMSPAWGNIYCHPGSHIHNDECGAPEFYTGGAKLITVDGRVGKIDPAALDKAACSKRGDVHATQPSCVSITQATEVGSVYTIDEVATIGDICTDAALGLHMDGSRFANALAYLQCSPADITWKAGVKALSFGATKNGVPGAEAIVLFDQRLATELAYRRKRAGHLFSKMRFLTAQIDAYLAHDLWLRNARQANAMAQRLVIGLTQLAGVEVMEPTQSNIIFCRLPDALKAGLLAAGFHFYHDRWEPGVVRFVTSFATSAEDIDHLLACMQRLSTPSTAQPWLDTKSAS